MTVSQSNSETFTIVDNSERSQLHDLARFAPDTCVELGDLKDLGLPNMYETVLTGELIASNAIESQRPLQIRPPLPGRYTTRVGERMGRAELLPLIDTWLGQTGGRGGFVVQGGNRYISSYLREVGAEADDLKVMSIDKAPLYVQLATLLTATERHERLGKDSIARIESMMPGHFSSDMRTMSREELLRVVASETVPSPFQSVTADQDLETELALAVDSIENNNIPIQNSAAVQEILANTKLAEKFKSQDDLHFLDDLFYRGRTLFSLAAIVKSFGGDPRQIRLTTLACDQKSADLTSPYHRVLTGHKLYPFENSIRTEQGYWQDIGDRYIFTDMANYWEYLHAQGENNESLSTYTEWQAKLQEWFASHTDQGSETDMTLTNPLLWLSVYQAAYGIEQNIDKIVDQKGYKIGASVPFMQLIDRFISQEEPVEARLAFKHEIRTTLAAIQQAQQEYPDDFQQLVDTYQEKQHSIDYHGLAFMFQDDAQVIEVLVVSEKYASIISQLQERIRQQADEMGRPILVGINGVDTSGKTELTKSLATALRDNGASVSTVHIDNFTNPTDVRHSGEDSIDNYYNRTFDIDGLRHHILRPIVEGQLPKVILRHVDPRDDSRVVEHSYDIAESPSVVLVEGVFIFRPELRGYFDYTIFLEMPLADMEERALVRDVPRLGFAALKKYRNKYIPTQQKYIETVEPHLGADVIIDCSDWTQPILRDTA